MAANASSQEPDGRAIYETHCANCHGDQLQGGKAQSLVDGEWLYGAGHETIARIIRHGITPYGMPAYGATLTEAEIQAVTEFILEQEEQKDPGYPIQPDSFQSLEYEIGIDVWASGLEVPWGLVFTGPESALFTERPGRLRVIENGRLRPEPVAGTPEVVAEGDCGLLDIALHPDYAQNGWVYLAFSDVRRESPVEARWEPTMIQIVRGRVRNHQWVDEEIVYQAEPGHYVWMRARVGCRLIFGPGGHLYFSIGDHGINWLAQRLDKPHGKTHRVKPDGTVPQDNPFVDTPGALPTIFTYGNRNAQGLDFHPGTGVLWESEHGPMGGDELNRLKPGANYGSPKITYGRDYSGYPVSNYTSLPGFEQPIWYWTPSIAVCPIAFYRGEEFPKWQDHLLVGSLGFQELHLATIVDGRVINTELLLKKYGRIRDLVVGPDDAIYVVFNGPGQICRLSVKRERTYGLSPAERVLWKALLEARRY